MKVKKASNSVSTAYSLAIATMNMCAEELSQFGCQAVLTVDTPAAVTFANTAVNTGTDVITATTHGLSTGLKGQFTTTGGLPAGISGGTDYFIIRVDADTFKVATTLNNAIAGTAIDITTQGTGNHTFTPTALAGGTIKLQESNDGTNWDDVSGSSQNVTATGNFWLSSSLPRSEWVRVYLTLTAGHISGTAYLYCYNPYKEEG